MKHKKIEEKKDAEMKKSDKKYKTQKLK